MEVLDRELRVTVRLTEREIGALATRFGEVPVTRQFHNAIQEQYSHQWRIGRVRIEWPVGCNPSIVGPIDKVDSCLRDFQHDIQAAVSRFGGA